MFFIPKFSLNYAVRIPASNPIPFLLFWVFHPNFIFLQRNFSGPFPHFWRIDCKEVVKSNPHMVRQWYNCICILYLHESSGTSLRKDGRRISFERSECKSRTFPRLSRQIRNLPILKLEKIAYNLDFESAKIFLEKSEFSRLDNWHITIDWIRTWPRTWIEWPEAKRFPRCMIWIVLIT